jgi:hypothetical protein
MPDFNTSKRIPSVDNVFSSHVDSCVEADLAMKERALNALRAPSIEPRRFRPTEGFSRSSRDSD